MANDLDAATARSPLNQVPQTQGPGGESNARFFQPFQEIGAKIGGFGDVVGAVGETVERAEKRADIENVPAAERTGIGSVARDSEGNVIIGTFDTSTASGRAANAAALQGGLALKQAKIQTDMQEMSQEHRNDPDGYRTAVDAYVKTIGQKDSAELRPQIRLFAMQLGEQHLRSLADEKKKTTFQNADIALGARLADQTNTLNALARQGGTETPEFRTAMSAVDDIYKAFGQNPAFGYPAERIASERENILSRARGESIVGEVDRTFDKSGKAEAQRILKDEILNNPKLNLTEQERGRLYTQGLSRLDFLSGERKADVAAHSGLVKDYLEKAQRGTETPDNVVDAIRDKALRLGDSDGVLKIDGMREAQRRTAGWKGLTDEQRMVRAAEGSTLRAPPALQPVFSAAAQRYSIPLGHLEAIVSIETGGRFNPNAQNPVSSAGGLGQFIDGTWRQYGNGKSKFDPEANVDALARLYVANRASLKQSLGREPALWELYAAHQQGAGGASALLTRPNEPAMAVMTDVVRKDRGVDFTSAPSVAARRILQNGGKTSMTAGEFLGLWRDKIQKVAGGAASTAIVGDIKGDGNPYTATYSLKLARAEYASGDGRAGRHRVLC